MNNNFYHWQNETRYKMQEVDHALEQARLLREAGLSNPGWLRRAVNSLSNLLNTWNKGLQARRSSEPKPFLRKSHRSA